MIPILIAFLLLFNLFLVGFFNLRYLIFSNIKIKIPKYKDLERKIILPVIIPVKNEDENFIISKIEHLKKLRSPNSNLEILFVFVDDTEIQKEINLLNYLKKNSYFNYSDRNFYIFDLGSVKYFFRLSGRKRKGEALKDIIRYLIEKYRIEYFSVYDIEWTITPDYLYKAVCILESNPNISFVYWNRRTVPIDYLHKLIGIYVDMFHEITLPMKNVLDGIAMVNGSCGVIKVKDYLDSGEFTGHITEDADLTVRMYLKGYSGIFIRDWIEYGQNLPPNFNMAIKTIRRWQTGTFDVTYRNLFKIIRSKKLNLLQKLSLIDLFSSMFSPILIVLPILIISIISIVFKIQSEYWLYLSPIFYFITLFVITVLIFQYYVTEKRIYGRGSFKDAFLVLLISWGLSALTIFYQLKRIIIGYEDKWIVTRKSATSYKIDPLAISIFIFFFIINVYFLIYLVSVNFQYFSYYSVFNLTIGALPIYIWILSTSFLIYLKIYYKNYKKLAK